MVMPASARRWTVDEVREMQQEERAWPRYELIDGELLVTPSPRPLHQLAVGNLFVLLQPYVAKHGIGATLMSPADIELVPGTIVQPDVFVIPLVNGKFPLEWQATKSLLLAVEILSPSSLRADRVTKRRFFARVAVAEYWVVDLDARLVERTRAGEERPEILDQKLEWSPAGATEPLFLDLGEFFERIHG
jgi:Uma2 family endonuclease